MDRFDICDIKIFASKIVKNDFQTLRISLDAQKLLLTKIDIQLQKQRKNPYEIVDTTVIVYAENSSKMHVITFFFRFKYLLIFT